MPVIARFFGIVVKMYLLGKEHNPPHVHIIYNELNAVIDLNSLNVIEGDLTGRGLAMATEWVSQHQAELLEMWETQTFRKLPPLE